MNTRGRPRHPEVLTPRQQEVLEHVRQGKTNQEIASEMGISPDGVKWHVSEILQRTGARRRREAAEWSERPSARLRGPRVWNVRRVGCAGRQKRVGTAQLEQELAAC